MRVTENYQPRTTTRRQIDRTEMARLNDKFLLWLILFALGLSAVMFSAGYYVASREAAQIVLENEKQMNKAYIR